MEDYLGDGLYIQDDGFQVTLSTLRGNGTHFVCLEPNDIASFFKFLERSRGLKITVTQNEVQTKEI